MKDEIKEILDKPKILMLSYGNYISLDDYVKLKDYITNLQEENERLKEENKRIFSHVNDDELLISNAMNYAEAQDYKSRIDKALEYIEENCGADNRLQLKIILQGSDKK